METLRRLCRLQGKSLTISHDQLLITLVQSAPLVATRLRAASGSGGSDHQPDQGKAQAVPGGGTGGPGIPPPPPPLAGSAQAMDVDQPPPPPPLHSEASAGPGAPSPVAGVNDRSVDGGSVEEDAAEEAALLAVPHGPGAWMQRWSDGASLADVPETAVLTATGELSLRVQEEARRRRFATEAGVVRVRLGEGSG